MYREIHSYANSIWDDNNDDAEPLYKRALAIGEETSGLTHPGMASILNNLANLLEAQVMWH